MAFGDFKDVQSATNAMHKLSGKDGEEGGVEERGRGAGARLRADILRAWGPTFDCQRCAQACSSTTGLEKV